MKFLAFVTPPPDIYHGSSTQNILWEEHFTLVIMKSCGRRNVSKHREISNGNKYIILDIYYKLDYMGKRELTSS